MPRSLPSGKPFVSRVHKQASERDGIVTFSPAEIIAYRRCPHFYRLRELWGYQAELVRELGFGKSVHHILSKLAEEAQQGKPLTRKRIDSALQEDFHLPFASPGGTSQILKRNEHKLKSYIEDHKEQLQSVKETEARLEFLLSKQASISGRVDVISGGSNGDEVRDYKTKDDPRTKDEAHFQVRLYVLGLRETGERVTTGSIGYVIENRDEPVDCSDKKLREARATAEQAIKAILAGNFPPRPGDHCQKCDYRTICSYRSVEGNS
jgi:DNA helicase-2/ATP-dependent DNA helicase PcrA